MVIGNSLKNEEFQNLKKQQKFLLTKIVATLGPASANLNTVLQLIEGGVRVFRINFSHGTFEEYDKLLNIVRRASKIKNIAVGVIGDLSGPKIRVGQVVKGGVILQKGDEVIFQKKEVVTGIKGPKPAKEFVFSTNYPSFIKEVQAGQKILLDDGNVQLLCHQKKGQGTDQKLFCEVIDGGGITSHKGVNLPDTSLSVPALTEKDYRCISFAVKREFDFLALSFVRRAEDIKLLKSHLKKLGFRHFDPLRHREKHIKVRKFNDQCTGIIPIISKIEKPQAIDHLEAIIKETDLVMVARGDLGVEMDLAEVAVLQKRIIRMCHDYATPVIVATQMLQSMIESPSPTRAEVSDVANAIFDGADAVMLSGETAVGKYPVETVQMMNRIATKTNEFLQSEHFQVSTPRKLQEMRYRTPALAHGVNSIVRDMEAPFIIMWSQMGGGALYLSQQRIPRPILAFSSNRQALRQMSVLYGVTPFYMAKPSGNSDFILQVDRMMLQKKLAKKGEAIVFVMGEPIDRVGVTNNISIHYLGESDR
jgi:pyruvate kinase